MPDEFSNWIDDELRRVPLPEGLLERLRRVRRLGSGGLTDEQIDEALCEVPLPSHLLQTLSAIPDDQQLDEHLRDVTVPDDLLEQVAFIPQDGQLRDIPVPVDLLWELRRIPPRRRRRLPTAQLALAASLLLMITMGYLLSMAGLMMNAYDRIPEPYALIVVEQSPVELRSSVRAEEAVTIGLAEQTPRREPQPTTTLAYDPTPPPVETTSIADRLAGEFGSEYSLSDDVTPLIYGILGQPYEGDDGTPDLELLAGIEPRGVEPPIALGFDRKSLIVERTNPFIPLAEIRDLGEGSEVEALLDPLKRSRLPLWTRSESFERLQQLAATGRLPSTREIHVEDFLAAVDFEYAPAEAQQLAIRSAAGPSVFGEDYAELLLIGVQAGALRRDDPHPLHVTLAVDVSDSMRWEHRLSTVRNAVSSFVRQLQPEDRLSLVVFNERAHVLLEDVSGDDRDRVDAALTDLTATGGTNLIAGLTRAAEAADSPVARTFARREVVLISDDMPPLSPPISAAASSLVGSMQDQEIELHVVALAADLTDEKGEIEAHAGLDELAAMAGRDTLRLASTGRLQDSLCERVIGISPVIARSASLTVTFNPQAVQKYRVLGHEATTAGGMLPADIQSTLSASEAATAVYELVLESDCPSLVATAEVEWTAADGRSRTVREEIHLRQFTDSWRGAPLSLQAAAVAAEAAEVLRQSPYTSARNRDLRAVLQQAEEVNPRLAQREPFRRFLRVLQQAEAARRGLPPQSP